MNDNDFGFLNEPPQLLERIRIAVHRLEGPRYVIPIQFKLTNDDHPDRAILVKEGDTIQFDSGDQTYVGMIIRFRLHTTKFMRAPIREDGIVGDYEGDNIDIYVNLFHVPALTTLLEPTDGPAHARIMFRPGQWMDEPISYSVGGHELVYRTFALSDVVSSFYVLPPGHMRTTTTDYTRRPTPNFPPQDGGARKKRTRKTKKRRSSRKCIANECNLG
jgi:hypothetical protein